MHSRILLRRAGAVAAWPVGMGLASWRYLWRTTPIYRIEESVERIDEGPQVPAGLMDDRVLKMTDGAGPAVNRRYCTAVCETQLDQHDLIRRITEDPNRVAPREVAIFRKVRGFAGRMDVGDEYRIRMPGPWDGPVRVVDRSPTSFRLATLRGHLEAGQIEFRASSAGSHLVFEIESWASSGDKLSALLYDRVGVAKELQLNMWIHVLQRVVRLTRGRMTGGVHVYTCRGQDMAHG